MKAIMAVTLGTGCYQAHPEAEVEEWEEVKDYAVSVRYLGPVEGPASFRHAVRVTDEDLSERVYLLDGDTI